MDVAGSVMIRVPFGFWEKEGIFLVKKKAWYALHERSRQGQDHRVMADKGDDAHVG